MITYKNFEDKSRDAANKLASYYEGDQIRFVKKILDGKMDGVGARKDWKSRGFIPRSRNITKTITDKSGLLMNKPPKLEIWTDNDTPTTDDTFDELMWQADWLEFFQNVDAYTRVLKTTIVLVQKYIPQQIETNGGKYTVDFSRGDAMILTLLHKGNCCVETNIIGQIIDLAYVIDPEPEWIQKDDDKRHVWYYRRITPRDITDVRVEPDDKPGAKEIIMNVVSNQENIVPAVPFYDVMKPSKGFWSNIPEDIVSFQELYNLHLTDIEFAIAHAKQKTLFLDTPVESTSGNTQTMTIPAATVGRTSAGEVYNDLEAAGLGGTGGKIGGLGEMVQLQPKGDGGNPFVKFDGPESDLRALNEIVSNMVMEIALDWDVNLRVEGSGSASSGFQLVVEEMNNLQLREKRSQSFQSGFRKFYDVMKHLYPELTQGKLLVDFADPSLPVNQKEQEEIWSVKISEGRASRKDYFMAVHEMTEEEAIAKIAEIDGYSDQDDGVVEIPDFTNTEE